MYGVDDTAPAVVAAGRARVNRARNFKQTEDLIPQMMCQSIQSISVVVSLRGARGSAGMCRRADLLDRLFCHMKESPSSSSQGIII